MSMVVKNNIAAQMVLGELNKSNSSLKQSLEKVSSGQKINSAKDDSAMYAISEKMREQIRSLDQDRQNVLNGSSLFKIADGAINNIVEELRHLKELAINSANDTNTDSDRLIIQKEFTQKMANINDIATMTTYNGKILLDGRYSRGGSSTAAASISSTETVQIKDSDIYTNTVTDLFDTTETVPEGTKSEYSGVSWINGKEAYGKYSTDWLTLDFSNAKKNGSAANLPNDMDKQGFTVLCSDYSGCPSFHAFIFDASMDAGKGKKLLNANGKPMYQVGIKGVTTFAALSKALYDGTKNIVENLDSSEQLEYMSGDIIHLAGYGDEVELRKNDDGTYSMMQHYPMYIYGGYDKTGQIATSTADSTDIAGTPLKIHHGPKANQATNFFINDMHTKSMGAGNLFSNNFNVDDPSERLLEHSDAARYNALSYDENKQAAWLETLTEASGKTLDDIKVTTQKEANVAIRVLDGAIEYALNEATYMGAYLQRLEHTGANVVTMGENVQAAESTIRDADMAKAMTEYTKYNVITQAAQSMLAQANQNSSQVLSLLQ